MMTTLLLAWTLLFADQIRVRVKFGHEYLTLTGFIVALCWAMMSFSPLEVAIAGSVAAVAGSFTDPFPLHKKLVNAGSLLTATLVACGIVYFLIPTSFIDVVFGGVVFELINMSLIAVAMAAFKAQTIKTTFIEWWRSGPIMILASFFGAALGLLWLYAPLAWPLALGAGIAFLTPGYCVFSSGSLLRGSWHTTPGTFQSQPK
jgi:hypothetical protein